MFSSLTLVLHSYGEAFACILAAALVAPTALYWLRRWVLAQRRTRGKLISSEIFSLFATLYAFFLGFSIATLWGNFTTAKLITGTEAANITNTYRLSLSLEGTAGFREALGVYTRCLVDDEWPTMNSQDRQSQACSERMEDVWNAYFAAKPRDKGDNTLYAGLGSSLAELTRNRVERGQLTSGNLYPPVWVILCFGMLAVLAGLFLTNPDQTPTQLVLEFVVSFMVLSCLYFIIDINTPFSGAIRIDASPLSEAYSTITTMAGAGK